MRTPANPLWKSRCLAGLCLFLAIAAFSADNDIESYTNSVNAAIPDADATGVSSTRTISNSGISALHGLELVLSISGGFNGDLYAYLQHGDSLSVLLDRVGKTTGSSFGYDDSGLIVHFNEAAPNGDIHVYRAVVTPDPGTPLTGFWQPDARTADPNTVTTSSPRSAGFSVFDGLNPNGQWTLFVADLSSGGQSVLVGWDLSISASPIPVPEPGSISLTFLGGIFLLLSSRRFRR